MMLFLSPGPQKEDQALTTLPWTEAKPVLVIWPQSNFAFLPVVSWKLPVAAGNWNPVSLIGLSSSWKGGVMQANEGY